jgi:hypothetical protein
VLLAAATVWVGRWALLELASYAGHRLLPRRPFDPHGPAPGWMPGPFDRPKNPSVGGSKTPWNG